MAIESYADGSMIAASYERVSTLGQSKHGYSLGAQEKDLGEFAADQGWVLPNHLRFRDGEDRNASGSDWDLPGLNAMLQAAEERQFSILVVPDFDRFARSQTKGMVLHDELRAKDIRVVFMHVPVDDSPEGRMMMRQLYNYAEYEREKFALRSARGRRGKAEKGLVVGSGPAPYGYQYVEDERGKRIGLGPNPETAWIIRHIFELLMTHSSYTVAKILDDDPDIPAPGNGVWHPHTILRWARDRVYRGELQYGQPNPITIPVPPLVESDAWDRLQRVLDRRHDLRVRRGQKSLDEDPFVLRGRLVCGHCGGAISCTSSSKYRYYECRRRAPEYAKRSGVATCDLPAVPAAALELHAWKLVCRTVLDQENIKASIGERAKREHEARETWHDRITTIEVRLAKERKRLDTVIDRLANADVGSEIEASLLRKAKEIEKSISKSTADHEEMTSKEPAAESIFDKWELFEYVWSSLQPRVERAMTGSQKGTVDLGEFDRTVVEKLNLSATIYDASRKRAHGVKLGRLHQFAIDWDGVVQFPTVTHGSSRW